MLILTRLIDEKIVINDEIEISIVEIDGDKVKIGIDAPKKYKIMRKELLEEIKSANIEASMASTENINKLNLFLKNAKENKKSDDI